MSEMMSEYEKEREAQIQKNKAMLESLNIHEITSKMVAPPKAKFAREKKRKFESVEPTEVRRSSRLSGAPPPKQIKLENPEVVSKKEPPKERREGDFSFESAATTATKEAHPRVYGVLKTISFEEGSPNQEKKEAQRQQTNDSAQKRVSPRVTRRTEGKAAEDGEEKKKEKKNEKNGNKKKEEKKDKKEKEVVYDSDKENENPQFSLEVKTQKKETDLKRKTFQAVTKENIKYSDLQVVALTKTVPERVYNMAIHPSSERIVCATSDKWGRIGIWDYGTIEEQQGENDLCIYSPHSAPVPGLLFSPTDCSKLFSCSYDGAIRCADIEKGQFLQLYYDPDETRNCVDCDPTSNYIVYSGSGTGNLTMIDTRSKKPVHHDLHQRKLYSVSVKPDTPHTIATCSTDQTLCVWDTRKMNKSVHKFVHKQAVTSCGFSKKTGKYLVSLCYDNHIRIWEDFKETFKINHNCNTGRWITQFKVAWDPKCESIFAVGNMTRSLDIFDASNGTKRAQLVDEDLTAIPSINAFHAFHNVAISATASGRTYVWK